MVPWWPVPNASAASISMPTLLGATRLAVMLAVHDEAPGGDGDEVFEAGPDPVLGLDGVEVDGRGGFRAGGVGHELAHQRLIGRIGKMHRDVPAAIRPFERSDRGLAFKKNFGQEHRRRAVAAVFVADRKTGAVGRG